MNDRHLRIPAGLESTNCVENVWPAPFARGFVEIGG
jgi:hypothetical protein